MEQLLPDNSRTEATVCVCVCVFLWGGGRIGGQGVQPHFLSTADLRVKEEQVKWLKHCFQTERCRLSFHCGSAVANLTSIQEDESLTPGLAQWVKHLALYELWWGSQRRLGSCVAVAVV